jgi:hypothetical protein
MSTLSPQEQELYDLAKGSVPRFLFQKKSAPQEILGAAAKVFAAAKTQIASWFSMTYIKDAVDFWEDQHAKDRGIRRQNGESTAALSARIRAYPDALTIPALLGVVNLILTAAGYPATASIVEARAAGAYYQDETLPSLQAYFGRGNRWNSRRHNLIVFLPTGTDAATQAACFAALNKWKAGGVGITIEIGSATGVFQRVSITPPSKIMNVTDPAYQFAAQTEHADTVTWKVNGIAGGNPTYGTISAGGLYTPPAATPFPEDIEIEAVSALDPTIMGRAKVKVIATPLLPLNPEVLADSPYFLWRLGLASYSGTTETDGSGNGRTGSISGSYFQYNAPGGPTYLATDNQGFTDLTFARVSSTITPPTGGGLTIEAWFSKDNATGGWFGDTDQHAFIKINSSGDISAGFDTASFNFGTIGNTPFSTGGHHLVFTWDGTTGKFYLDGVLKGSMAMAAPGGALSNFALNPLFTSSWGGSWAECAVYTSALSAARITDHYLAGTGQLH